MDIEDLKMTKHQQLISQLIYPAFLGACFVWFAQHLAAFSVEGNIYEYTLKLLLGLWLISYNSVPFLLLSSARNDYGGQIFSADLIDVALIFLSFLSLGLIDGRTPSFPCVYIFIGLIPLSAIIGQCILPRDNRQTKPRIFIYIGTWVITLAATILQDKSDCVNFVAVILLFLILGYYLKVVLEEI